MAPTAIRDYGDRAVLIECDCTAEVLDLAAVIERARLPEVLDIVPAARTVLVTLAGPAAQQLVRDLLHRIEVTPHAAKAEPGTPEVVIDVTYDGPDLAEVADRLGTGPGQVVEAHTARPWRVGFGGFAPGFAYLIDGDPRLRVPRRDEPRTRVPAGSVGLAGEFSGIYPRESPGGWQLIGRTDAALWDPGRARPALLRPGMWVRFRALPGPR